jgi:hypothetical protein
VDVVSVHDRVVLTVLAMQVGAGKSSLISAILGQMTKVEGRVEVVDSVAYVAQQAWIQNATVKNNILFGKEMDWHRYQEIVCTMNGGAKLPCNVDDVHYAAVGVFAGLGSGDFTWRRRNRDW